MVGNSPQRPDGHEPAAHHGVDIIDINTASVEELAGLPGMDIEKARLICARRPFDGWAELERLPGFDANLLDELKAGRAEIRIL